MIRICICIDVDTDDAETAYGIVFDKMLESRLDWESSDEWYGDDGEPLAQDVISEARMRVLAKRPLEDL